MSEVQTFRAATMQEALDLVRQTLGADAVILHTREISHRRLLPFRKAKREVEITAGLEKGSRPPATARRPANAESAAPPRPAAPRPTMPVADNRAARRGGQLDLASEPSPNLAELLRMTSSAAARESAPRESVTREPVARESAPQRHRAPRRASFAAKGEAGSDRIGTPAAPPRPLRRRVPAPAPAPSPSSAEGIEQAARFAAKLDAIHKMIESLGRSGHVGRVEEIPGELFQLYTELIDAEVEEQLARDLVCRLKGHCTPAQLADADAPKALLTGMVQSELRCCDSIAPRRGQRKVVALVGSTGVGKTTTIAKLAANFRLRDNIRMGLVTVDTYRIAAVEQLRTYAEIIDLPMKIVTSPQEMKRALDELAGLDLVLIDTAGRSPRDELQIQELKSLLAEAHVDEVHLVLSMTSSLRNLEASVQKFSAASPTALILTKLDEAAGLGSLLSIARRIPLPISYVTTGQGVPDDIEPARSDRLARLVLGLDKLGG